MKKNIAIITGPTASGKTAVSIEVAKRLNGEIISADSMQIYKYMDIGSAKPDEKEMSGIPHHLIDVVYPHEDFSVAMFRNLAAELITNITGRAKLPIIVGGTGLYINSLTHNLNFTDISYDKIYREQLTDIAKTKGNEHLHKMLEAVDIESYHRLFPNDVKRVIRALEVYENTGKTISEYQRESKEKPIPFNLAYVGLTMDRQRLYERINQRVETMFDKGLIEEVIKLRSLGYNKNMVSMQGIGYKEIYDYLDGLITLSELKVIIKQSSRNYAKRQLTWFRRDERIHWVNIDDYEAIDGIIENIIDFIEGKFEII
jgi:tRNA dimethylallyltransferase